MCLRGIEAESYDVIVIKSVCSTPLVEPHRLRLHVNIVDPNMAKWDWIEVETVRTARGYKIEYIYQID